MRTLQHRGEIGADGVGIDLTPRARRVACDLSRLEEQRRGAREHGVAECDRDGVRIAFAAASASRPEAAWTTIFARSESKRGLVR